MTPELLLISVVFGCSTVAALGYALGWLHRGHYDAPFIRLAYRAGRVDLKDELTRRVAKALPPPQPTSQPANRGTQ